MNALDSISPQMAVIIGAVLGLIVNGTRLRDFGRFIPPAALVLVVVGLFARYPFPALLVYVLVGAGAVVSVARLFGGR